MNRNDITLERFKAACNRLNYKLKSEGITTFGIRNSDMTTGLFNDFLGIYFISGGSELLIIDTGTVDPGTYYLNKPMNKDGTAVMVKGFWEGAYCKGKHKGYDALVQCKAIDFYRITKNQFKKDNEGVLRGKWQIKVTGKSIYRQIIGANQHRANPSVTSTDVGMWSAGCQVRNNPKEYNKFIETCYKSPQKYFDYILFLESEVML